MKHVVVAAGWPFKQTRFVGKVRTSPASSLKAPNADGMGGRTSSQARLSTRKTSTAPRRTSASACSSSARPPPVCPTLSSALLHADRRGAAHDAASSCTALGIAVTLHQRSPTFVMSIAFGMLRVSAAADWEAQGTATEDVDRGRFALLVGLAKGLVGRGAGAVREADRERLERLEQAGYRTSRGEADVGAFLHLLRGSGYYLGARIRLPCCARLVSSVIYILLLCRQGLRRSSTARSRSRAASTSSSSHPAACASATAASSRRTSSSPQLGASPSPSCVLPLLPYTYPI